MTAHQTADVDKPHRGRRLTWEEFRRLTGREPPKAVNDNGPTTTIFGFFEQTAGDVDATGALQG